MSVTFLQLRFFAFKNIYHALSKHLKYMRRQLLDSTLVKKLKHQQSDRFCAILAARIFMKSISCLLVSFGRLRQVLFAKRRGTGVEKQEEKALKISIVAKKF